MSPAGFYSSRAYVWCISGNIYTTKVSSGVYFSPVINLNANVKATGTGTELDPYVVQTN